MHLIIISGATRPQAKSNTAKVIDAFCKGFLPCGHTAEAWYLSDRTQWDGARRAFAANTDILFALPLYVENIPGTMLEFLETLPPKTQAGTRIFFLLQGGFPEASQSRCCERFLKTLPAKLGCEYGGTLIRGDMFGVGLLGDKMAAEMLQPFTQVGRLFAQNGGFDDTILKEYASPEYLTPIQIKRFNRFGKYMQKFFMGLIAKKLGCKTRLDAKVYREES